MFQPAVLVALPFIAGCSIDTAGGWLATPDARSSRIDAGRGIDGGGSGGDGGSVDAGVAVPFDAGAPPSDPDAGPPPSDPDAGPPPEPDAGPPPTGCGTAGAECAPGSHESTTFADCFTCTRLLTRFCTAACTWGPWQGAMSCSDRRCGAGGVDYCLGSVGQSPRDLRFYLCCDDDPAGDWDWYEAAYGFMCMPEG